MSYQLPDLLGLSTSLASANDDGDLHINPSYNEVSSATLSWLLTHLPRSNTLPTANGSRLQKTIRGFLNEYNPGLLASTYFPFSPVSNTMLGPSILQVATEWLGICAIATEETLRPRRIIDFELGVAPILSSEATSTGKSLKDLLAQSPWQCIAPHLSDFSSTISGVLRDYVQELLLAHLHPPPKPKPSSHSPTPVTEYLEWRISLSGLRILAELFLSLDKHPEYQYVLVLILEIITCVTDLFAYNIHQAWHSQSNNNNNHLNILSYLLTADPTLTLQGGVNIIGGMIRDRTAQLKDELETLKHQPQSPLNKTSGVLASILSPFFTGTQDAASNDSNDGDPEIRRTLVNWVMGTIHWAYEAEYFFPKLEDEPSESGSRRNRGGEIRDYGWIFLIKTGEELNE